VLVSRPKHKQAGGLHRRRKSRISPLFGQELVKILRPPLRGCSGSGTPRGTTSASCPRYARCSSCRSHVLVSHGEPVHDRAAFEAALEREPWDRRAAREADVLPGALVRRSAGRGPTLLPPERVLTERLRTPPSDRLAWQAAVAPIVAGGRGRALVAQHSCLRDGRRCRGARVRVLAAWLIGPTGYTSGMKTAVSIPDELFRKADELANRLGKSRSEVYREALADYVSRREPGNVTRALDELADELAADGGQFGAQAARRALERSEW